MWEMKGSCDLSSLIYRESMKVLHGRYLCGAGISGGLDVVVPGLAEGASSRAALISKAWWQLPGEGEEREKARVKCPFVDVPPKLQQRAAVDPAMLSTGSLTQLSDFCFALCVNLLEWQGTGLSALCLGFLVWVEGLISIYSRSAVWWRQVH